MNSQQRRCARRAWERAALNVMFPDGAPTHIQLTRAQLNRLPEYTHTIPTGARPGRRWRGSTLQRMHYLRKRYPQAAPPRWLARYADLFHVVAEVLPEPHPEGGYRIAWSRVRLVAALCARPL